MAGAALLVLLGSLTITQVLFGEAFERLNVKSAITGASSGASTQPSSDTSGGASIQPASLSGASSGTVLA
jgi:hypothetical protein